MTRTINPTRIFATFLLAAAILVAAMAQRPVRAGDDGIISIGWTAWADAEAVSKLVAIIVGQGMKKPVELTLSDIDIQYRNIAAGNLDVMLMAWLPNTHGGYMEKYGKNLVDLGPIYEGTRIGWAVPAYIPADQVATPADLRAVRDQMAGRIIGIDESAGLTAASRRLIADTSLSDWTLETGTGPLMAKKVGESYEEQEWFVATVWNPHWIFAVYDLRYLEDPNGHFGDPEKVHALARPGFQTDYPDVAAFLRRFEMDISQVEALMADAREYGHKKAAYKFINENKQQVDFWIKGAQ